MKQILLERYIFQSLKDRPKPIRVGPEIIHDLAEYSKGAAYRITTGGKYRAHDLEFLAALGVEINEAMYRKGEQSSNP